MAIYRINKTKDYTIIANYHLREKEMSLKAKGLLTLFLSLPDNWNFSVNGITEIVKESRNTVNEIMRELEKFKYLKRKAIRTDKGTIIDWQYDIYEKPHTNYQDMENQDIDYQDMDNCIQVNTNIINNLNNKELNNKKIYKDKFLEFWEAYPKKLNKSKTEEWFIKNKPDNDLLNEMLTKLEMFKQSESWLKDDGKFIPYPTTWLNQKRWEDEIEEPEGRKYILDGNGIQLC